MKNIFFIILLVFLTQCSTSSPQVKTSPSENISCKVKQNFSSEETDPEWFIEKEDEEFYYIVKNKEYSGDSELAKIKNIYISEILLANKIAEDFMNKLKDLFTESHIHVPEESVNVVDELAETVEELEATLNDATEKSIHMAEELELYKRESIIREATKGLAETQIEKLKSLAENVDFDNEETFAMKVAQLKESYFAKATITQDEITEDEDGPITESSSSMDQYLKAIKKTANK